MPTHYLAIDVGSTSVTAIIIDLDSKTVVGTSTVANTTEITSVAYKNFGRSEWDLERMTELAVSNAANRIKRTKTQPAAIGITGQQQGLQLLDNDLNTVGRFISWQDQRSKELLPGEKRTYLDAMGELGGAVTEEGGLPARNRLHNAKPVLAKGQQPATDQRSRHNHPRIRSVTPHRRTTRDRSHRRPELGHLRCHPARLEL
jgi:glycerol kinase